MIVGCAAESLAQSLPAPWIGEDIGSPAVAGSSSWANGIFTVTGAGEDIWNEADEFHFVYRSMQGDFEIVARVDSLTEPHPFAKGGVMIRETLAAGSPNVLVAASPGNGWTYQRRREPNGDSLGSGSLRPPGKAPGWVRLVRAGHVFTGYYSPDGTTWTRINSDTVVMGTAVYVGLAVTSNVTTTTATAKFSSVTLTGAGGQPPTVSITSPANGAKFTAPASITITANAADSDGTVARVDFSRNGQAIGSDTTAPYSVTWSNVPAGSYTLTATAVDNDGDSAASSVAVTVATPSNAPPSASMTSPANGATFTAPASIALAATAADADGTVARVDFFQGTQLIGSDASSPYGAAWNNVPAGSYSLTAVAYDNGGASTTSAAVNVTVTAAATTGLPAPWVGADIGNPAVAGRSTWANGIFTVTGAGEDIWDQADEFHFVYRSMQGDFEVVARVDSLTEPHDFAKGGVMIRETLAAGSRNVLVAASPAKGWTYQHRPEPNGTSIGSGSARPPGKAPGWVRLVRAGNVFTGYYSPDRVTWTRINSSTVVMTPTVYVGLAVTSNVTTTTATATFSNVAITGGGTGAQAPTAAITSPANGATFTAPASIAITANATDSDGTVARVDFFRDGQSIGSDTSAPYSVTWSNVAAGTYSLTARATDNAGATTTSAAVTVTVGSTPPPIPTAVAFAPSPDHDTAVTSYSVALYRSGDPVTATPVATKNLGKPAPVNGEIRVDISDIVNPLPAGSYYAVVTATGAGGSSSAPPSASFTK